MEEKTKSVAVVGAGLSGLLALFHLSKNTKSNIRLCAFEKNYDIGGLWLYTDHTSTNDFGLPVYTGAYKYMKSNIPKPLMTLPGLEFEENVESFPSREVIFNYLKSFCEQNNLRQYIKFNTLVKEVKQFEPENRATRWEVTYSDIRKKDSCKTEIFDYVIVGSGNFVCPNIPVIKGSEFFKGYITHSMYYRHPEIYKGQIVAILGGKYSAFEIGLQLSGYAEKVYMCNRGVPFPSPLPKNFIQVLSGFDHILADKVVLENGEIIAVDSILYCTGYDYNFPFLPKDFVQTEDNRIRNLYKDIVPAEYSTIMFLSLPRDVAFFLQTGEQARFISALIDGSVLIPDQVEMKRAIDEDFDRRVVNWHTQFDYNKEIAKIGNFKPLPEVLKKIADYAFENYCTKFQEFREYIYEKTGPDSFTVTLQS